MRHETAALILWLAAASSHVFQPPSSQSPSNGPTFDVVSIKRNVSVRGPGYRANVVTWRPDGGLTIINAPVSAIVARAYPGTVPADFADRLPAWAREERYDVRATSTLARATPDDRTAMLRAMLADRFKLVVHIEQREQPAFDLVLARSDGRLGAGLVPLEVDCDRMLAERAAAAEADLAAGNPPAAPQRPDLGAPPAPCTLRVVGAVLRDGRGDRANAQGDLLEGETALDNLAKTLRIYAGRVVVDKTGLTGSYRVTMNFDMLSARRPPSATIDAGPSIFTAVQEQLGLKLQSSRAILETLVIDRLERPTEN